MMLAKVRKQISTVIEKIRSMFVTLYEKRGNTMDVPLECKNCLDLLASMKIRYPQISSKGHQMLMLTCCPISVSIREGAEG